MAGKIFVNYRRDDERAMAARVRDRLANAFGSTNVFMDVDNLMAGQRFDKELEKALSQTDVFIAVIGPRWMQLFNERAASGERDYVREEIAGALSRNILVVPVLIERAGLPRQDALPEDIRAILLHQKHDVAHERFGRDIEELIEAIRAGRKAMKAGISRQGFPVSGMIAGALGALALGWAGAHYAGLSVPWWPAAKVEAPVAVEAPKPDAKPEQTDAAKREQAAREAADAEAAARQKAEAEAAEEKKKVEEAEQQRQALAAAEVERKRAEDAEAKRKAEEEKATKRVAAAEAKNRDEKQPEVTTLDVREQSDKIELEDSIRTYVESKYLKDLESYDGQVDYFDKGIVDPVFISEHKRMYAAKWPVRHYSLIPGTLQIEAIGNATYAVSFGYSYSVENGAKRAAGGGRAQLKIRSRNGQFLVSSVKEIVVGR